MAICVSFFLLLAVTNCWLLPVSSGGLRLVRQWTDMEYVFPNEATKQAAISNKHYNPAQLGPPIDVDVDYRNGPPQQARIFLTTPRIIERPATLGTLDSQGRIVPYPDYTWHDRRRTNCEGLTSVFRIAIDRCRRLWAIDSGIIGSRQSCPVKLLAFDLETDQLIFNHQPQETVNSFYVTPIVDVRGKDCQNTFVYVADVKNFGLLVVDVTRSRSWRVTHRLFYPYPNWGTFTIDGVYFENMDGVLGMALSPETPSQDRVLYFHALAAKNENYISTAVLRNESFVLNPNVDVNVIKVFPNLRDTQAAAEAMDRNGILFFGGMEPPAIYCWSTSSEFSQQNFHQVAVDRETLQFASGLKVVDNLKGEQELWVMTCSFQRVMTGRLSSKQVNFRILAEKVTTLLKNSPCLY